jgi:hypothetical protein
MVQGAAAFKESVGSHVKEEAQWLTFGIAYTKEPMDVEAAGSS